MFGSNTAEAVSSVVGQQEYTTAGTYSWTCPAGVTSVSVVCVGAGGGGGDNSNGGSGGALAYKNNIAVVPGNSYTVYVGPGGLLAPLRQPRTEPEHTRQAVL